MVLECEFELVLQLCTQDGKFRAHDLAQLLLHDLELGLGWRRASQGRPALKCDLYWGIVITDAVEQAAVEVETLL